MESYNYNGDLIYFCDPCQYKFEMFSIMSQDVLQHPDFVVQNLGRDHIQDEEISQKELGRGFIKVEGSSQIVN